MPRTARSTKIRPTSRPQVKKRRGKKSSLAARRLIRAALKQFHSQRNAAHALRLSSHGALTAMLAGRIRDTPEMIAALARADARAKKAWSFVKADKGTPLDRELVCRIANHIEIELDQLKALCKP